jgi:hypothetical protein
MIAALLMGLLALSGYGVVALVLMDVREDDR